MDLLAAVRASIKVTEKLMRSTNEEVRLAAVNQLHSLTMTAAQLADTLYEPDHKSDDGPNPLVRRTGTP